MFEMSTEIECNLRDKQTLIKWYFISAWNKEFKWHDSVHVLSRLRNKQLFSEMNVKWHSSSFLRTCYPQLSSLLWNMCLQFLRQNTWNVKDSQVGQTTWINQTRPNSFRALQREQSTSDLSWSIQSKNICPNYWFCTHRIILGVCMICN